eukprot:Gb_09796 [translate_table: standard]
MAEAKNGNVKQHPHDGTAAKTSSDYEINVEIFGKRLKTFYANWKEHEQDIWGGCGAIAVSTPPPSEDSRYLKSSALNIWLLGYEFLENIMATVSHSLTVLVAMACPDDGGMPCLDDGGYSFNFNFNLKEYVRHAKILV